MGVDVDLGVSTEQVTGGWLVEVSGEVDLHTAPQLRGALDVAVASAGESPDAPTAVLVDLTGVGFMDSTGLGELMGAHKALQRADGQLHLAVPQDRVRRLLTLTGLDDVLAVHPDREAGLRALAGTG